jgi:hypothetical protein
MVKLVVNMPDNNLFQDSKALVTSMLRSLEMKRAGSDTQKIKELSELSDDETLRKWLWTASVIGAPVCFIALPILMLLLGVIFSSLVMNVLWFVTKLAMGFVLLLFAGAAYLTWRKEVK